MLLLADLVLTITKTIIASLDLDFEHFYESHFQNCTYTLRINHYTSDGKAIEQEALIPHTDSGIITILYTCKEGGLQIRSKEGKWLDVKPQHDSFVINIADCLKVRKKLLVLMSFFCGYKVMKESAGMEQRKVTKRGASSGSERVDGSHIFSVWSAFSR